jgi:hypothetical protein
LDWDRRRSDYGSALARAAVAQSLANRSALGSREGHHPLYYDDLSSDDRELLAGTIIAGLPGAEEG